MQSTEHKKILLFELMFISFNNNKRSQKQTANTVKVGQVVDFND